MYGLSPSCIAKFLLSHPAAFCGICNSAGGEKFRPSLPVLRPPHRSRPRPAIAKVVADPAPSAGLPGKIQRRHGSLAGPPALKNIEKCSISSNNSGPVLVRILPALNINQ
jgi:hypothetical protein